MRPTIAVSPSAEVRAAKAQKGARTAAARRRTARSGRALTRGSNHIRWRGHNRLARALAGQAGHDGHELGRLHRLGGVELEPGGERAHAVLEPAVAGEGGGGDAPAP